MRCWVLVLVVMVGCGDDAPSNPDAALADVPVVVDAPLDGAVDALVTDDCPGRTAPAGMPETPPSADELVTGDVTVRNALDVTGLAGKKVISGSLTIDTTELATVTLPDLEVVAGSVTIRADAGSPLATVELPRLETVGVAFAQQTPVDQLTAVRLPRLETLGRSLLLRADELDVRCLRGVEGTLPSDGVRLFEHAGTTLALTKLERGNLGIGGMPNLTVLDLPAYVAGSLHVGDSQPNPSLTSISAPLLATADLLVLEGSPLLTSVTFATVLAVRAVTLRGLALPDLAWLAQSTTELIAISELDQITTLDGLPASVRAYAILNNDALVDVDILAGEQTLGELTLINNDALQTIDLAQLTAIDTTLKIEQHAVLTRVVAPLLVSVSANETSSIRDNPMLPNACATAIRTQVLANDPDVVFVVSGNGAGACP